jgi:hypothetical protein
MKSKVEIPAARPWLKCGRALIGLSARDVRFRSDRFLARLGTQAAEAATMVIGRPR